MVRRAHRDRLELPGRDSGCRHPLSRRRCMVVGALLGAESLTLRLPSAASNGQSRWTSRNSQACPVERITVTAHPSRGRTLDVMPAGRADGPPFPIARRRCWVHVT